MSSLKRKANFNFSTSIFLKDRGYDDHYPTCIHGFYYSCFQYSKHFALESGYTEEELNPSGDSVHAILLNTVRSELRNLETRHSNDYNSQMVKLRRLRIKSDYKNEDISFDDVDNSESIANSILEILKKYSP